MLRLINADKLKEYIDAQKGRPFICCTIGEALKIMTDEQPTVDAVPVRHGTWKKVVPSRWGSLFECSECGEKATESVMGKPRYEYCPMCGAKMDGKRPEE